MVIASLLQLLQEREGFGQDLLLGKVNGGQIEITVGASVTQPPVLFVQVLLGPPHAPTPSLTGGTQRHIQVDEQIGRIQALPHIGYVGVILGCRARVIAQLPQSGCQHALAGCTWADQLDTHGSAPSPT